MDVVILSTAEWDNPFWTNKQHVAAEFARRGYRVLYIDSLGHRRPSVRKKDILRMIRRAQRGFSPPREVRRNLWVCSPIAIPLQGSALVRWLNRRLLSGALRSWLRFLRMRRPILWTYNPLTSVLLPMKLFGTVVYHCVDEMKAQPGMPSNAIEEAEILLLQQSDICFVTSTTLLRTRVRYNSNTHYLPNVADYRHFAKATEPETPEATDLQAIARPIVGFIGAVVAYKLDLALLRHMAALRPEWSIVLVGPIGEGDPTTDIQAIRGLPNLHLVGPRPYSELPKYLKAFTVAILPNVLNEYTRAMFPMKFFEYLAAGKPVVSTNLPALHEFRDYVYLAKTHDEFISRVSDAIELGSKDPAGQLALAERHTYVRRMETMLELVKVVANSGISAS